MTTVAIDQAFAERFAAEWVAAWNARDLDRVLSHYTDDFEMSSPVIAQIASVPEARLQGKRAVRAYWAEALSLLPDLRFELLAALLGVNSVAIHYRGAGGRLVVEVFSINEAGLAFRAHAHYEI